MQKNWYVVYIKPHHEKKVASLFTKRKIENFYPLNYRKIKSFGRNKILREPLFKSYVFAKITPAELALLKQTPGVISILYWKDEPAVIRQDEIDVIKSFAGNYQDIELNRVRLSIHDTAQVINGPSYLMEVNTLGVKNKIVKINLPSLGYIMMAKTEDESIFGREIAYKAIHPVVHTVIQATVTG